MHRQSMMLALAGALLMVIGWEIAERPRDNAVARHERAEETQSATPLLHADHLRSGVATLLARPPFSPDRRPAEQAGAQSAGAPGLPRLTGIIVGPFGRRAIFDGHGRESIVVDEGGRVDAYTVQSIDMAQVEMLGPNGMQRVRPAFDNATQEVVAPGPARRTGQAAGPR